MTIDIGLALSALICLGVWLPYIVKAYSVVMSQKK